MASDLFEKWLVHFDSIHRGYTPMGIANGVTATGGWSFPRVGGGYNLYRGTAGVESIAFDQPVGAAGANATAIGNSPWRPHRPSTTYHYAVRAIGGGGVESAAGSPVRTAEFDAEGVMEGPRPESVSDLVVTPYAGGRFSLRWTYNGRGAEATPQVFRVFHDGGAGSVDFTAVIAEVAYRRGQVHYAWTSGVFPHGARRVWAVRAVTAAGMDDGGEATAFAFADASAPPAHPGVRLVGLAEEEGA